MPEEDPLADPGADGRSRFPNRLIHEKSPYLLQHAENPVDWYPWSEEAFLRAAREDKPVFLSIGYATCHWCHVMAHESFEDTEVATLLNRDFIPIKVDREERPDIDSVYMAACQQMTGQGGWPLTVVMTPEKKPFFAASYIPRETRFSLIGLLTLLPRITQVWRERRSDLDRSGDRVIAAISEKLFGKKESTYLKLPHLEIDSLTPLDKKRLVKNLHREMLLAAQDLNFELAAEIRDRIKEIKEAN